MRGSVDPGKFLCNLEACNSFAFQSVAWRDAEFTHVRLKNNYRQVEPEYIQALADIHLGNTATESVAWIAARYTKTLKSRGLLPDGVEPMCIFGTREEVKEYKEMVMTRLVSRGGRMHVFKARDTVLVDDRVVGERVKFVQERLWEHKYFKDDVAAEAHIKLVLGAQVRLTRSSGTKKTYTGMRGVVRGFVLVPEMHSVDANGQKEVMLIEKKHLHLFRGCANVEDVPHNGKLVMPNGKVWIVKDKKRLPLVEFDKGRKVLTCPVDFVKEIDDEGVCISFQIPLSLAHACTVHGAQGMEFDFASYFMRSCWVEDQGLGGLSRATSSDGLETFDWDPDKIIVDEHANLFHAALSADDVDESVEEFLANQAGVWWCLLLKNEEVFKCLVEAEKHERAHCTKIVMSWVREHGLRRDHCGWGNFVHSPKLQKMMHGSADKALMNDHFRSHGLTRASSKRSRHGKGGSGRASTHHP